MGSPSDGLLFGHAQQLGVQAIAVVATFVYSGVDTAAILLLIRAVAPLRAGAARRPRPRRHPAWRRSVRPRKAPSWCFRSDVKPAARRWPALKGGIGHETVVAIVRPERLDEVLEELFKAEVQGLTLSRVQGHGGETEHVETYRGMSVKMELSEKVRLEIGVSDHFVEPTVRPCSAAARTGDVGDGKIFVLPVEKVYRIRTGEEDQAAVTPVEEVGETRC